MKEVRETREFLVQEGMGIRLDIWLGEQLEITRSQLKNLIAQRFVLVNGEGVKAGYRVKDGDRIFLSLPKPQLKSLEPEAMPLDIIYEDDHIAVINKPKGLVVHPAAGHWDGTLVNALLYHFDRLSTAGGPLRPGIVHRLDKDTSGLMIIAKHNEVHEYLTRQLKNRLVKRHYLALVHGALSVDEGVIDAPMGRHPRERTKMAIVESGRRAVTYFTVMDRFPKYSLVECRLETGRTHQIRVHLASIHHQIVGDPVYGRRSFNLGAETQVLHAAYLAFHHIDGRLMEFNSDLPEEFENILEKARLIS